MSYRRQIHSLYAQVPQHGRQRANTYCTSPYLMARSINTGKEKGIDGAQIGTYIAGKDRDAAAMGFWSDVQWWEDWQLRFLVLASLCFQYFLFAAALLRKRRVPPWFRSLVWLAYQGGDVVAVYALATLFNRHRKDEVAAGAAHLDTLWAPVLLLHLGGQDGITAYGVEDNENWRRHLLVAASQVSAVRS